MILRNHLPLVFILIATAATAQGGWEHYFGGAGEDFGQSIVQTPDDGFLVVGFSESFGADNDDDIYLLKVDVDGDFEWQRVVDEGFLEHGYDLAALPDGNYAIAGDLNTTPGSPTLGYLLVVNAYGDRQWSQTYGTDTTTEVLLDVQPLSDGGFLLAGRTGHGGDTDGYLLRTDADGTPLWQWISQEPAHDDDLVAAVPFADGFAALGNAPHPQTNSDDLVLLFFDSNGTETDRRYLGTNEFDRGYVLTTTPDGGLLVGGQAFDHINGFVVRLDADKNVLWQQTPGTALGEQVFDLVPTADGGCVLFGLREVTVSDIDMWLARLDGSGELVWERTIGRNENFDDGRAMVRTRNGGFALVGTNSLNGIFFNDVSVVLTNENGDVFTNALRGRVYFDTNGDCAAQPPETGLPDWLVVAEGAGQTYYGSTDSMGYFQIPVDTGQYSLRVLTQNAYWEPCVAAYNAVNASQLYDTVTLDFPIHAVVACPLLEVNLSSQWVQPCDAGLNYFLRYCNRGTAPEPNAYVDVTLDPNLTFNFADQPLLSQNGNVFRFDLGNVPVGGCGMLTFNVDVSCDLQPTQTVVNSAEIFPQTTCLPPDPAWDGSSLEVEGQCAGSDGVEFQIRNVGLPMLGTAEWIIIEDDIVLLQGSFNLGPNEALPVAVPMAQGSTYRLVTTQSPGHPGASFPTLAIEGCNAEDGTGSTGFYTQLPEDDQDPTLDVNPQEAIGANDPAVRLTGHPKGYLRNDTTYLAAGRQVEYHLNWTNQSTDTLRRWVVRDTLSPVFDLNTLRGGASSHAYRTRIYGDRTVRFVFEADLLPGETGFLRFTVGQMPDLPAGTVLENRATLYPSGNVPRTTNPVRYTIGGAPENFILVTASGPETTDVAVQIAPNPFAERAVLTLPDAYGPTEKILRIFTAEGRHLRDLSFMGTTCTIERAGLPSGLLAWRLDEIKTGRRLTGGRLILY